MVKLVLFCTQNTALNLYFASSFIPTNSQTLMDLLSFPLSKLLETISLSIVALFCSIVWVVYRMFNYLNLKAAEFSSILPLSIGSFNLIKTHLENWRRQHTLVCQLVDRINSCFGIILLVAMTHSFVSFISDTYEIALAYTNNSTLELRFFIRLFQHFTLLTLVCLGSYLLQAEVPYKYLYLCSYLCMRVQ